MKRLWTGLCLGALLGLWAGILLYDEGSQYEVSREVEESRHSVWDSRMPTWDDRRTVSG
jgi:hypothetical protein